MGSDTYSRAQASYKVSSMLLTLPWVKGVSTPNLTEWESVLTIKVTLVWYVRWFGKPDSYLELMRRLVEVAEADLGVRGFKIKLIRKNLD